MACSGCVLIVDDDADIRAALSEHIADLGCPVVVAVDGVHALECLGTCPPPCLILLDLNMPRLDGQGFLERIRGDSCQCSLRVASMTAGGGGQPDGTHAHLRKPFEVEALHEVLRQSCREPGRLQG